MVCRHGLCLRHLPMVHHLGSEHEAQGKDYRGLWSQSRRLVSFRIPSQRHNCGTIQLIET